MSKRQRIMQQGFVFIVMVLFILFPRPSFCSQVDPRSFPDLINHLNVAQPLTFCGEKTPLDIQEVKERLEKEMLLTLWDRPQIILWLKRSRRYLSHIESELKKKGMPDDLKYVAIAESALRPHAGSNKGAIGFWQFMAHTGRKYGLTINRNFDQRRNIFYSTQAAIRYLAALHDIFGSWTLAAAAYNMGEHGLMTHITEQGVTDYYQLYLPLETQRYIFRILSAKLIFTDPEQYGLHVRDEDYYPPLKFDRTTVQLRNSIPLRIIAHAANSHFKAIKDLNPEIRGNNLIKGHHQILLPQGALEGFHERLKKLTEKYMAAEKNRYYIVKNGDSLSGIAEKFDIPLSTLILKNGLDPGRHIHPGDRLKID